MTATPRSFTEVAGWRESFRAAAKRLDEVRVGSLFPDIAETLCGESVRLPSLADWTILDQADNPLVCGGRVELRHCANFIWLLSSRFIRDGRRARWRRAALTWRVMRWAKFDERVAIDAVLSFVDDAFLDMPGHFSATPARKGVSATQWPRRAQEISLCGEVMQAYPSFTYAELRAMPLAQFWQWLHAARASKIPDYRNYQLTDEVNQAACAELNRLRAQAKSA